MIVEDLTVDALTEVSRADTERAVRGPRDPVTHARWLESLACLHEVEVAPPPPARPIAGEPGRVVGWNVERGRNVSALARVLSRLRPELVLLSEVDVGMARSGNVHTPRGLAQRLGMGFAYAVEFVELGLGGAAERAAHAGETNESGFHGGAILSSTPLERPAVVRLETKGTWFDGARDEPRIGGRIAVLGTWHCQDEPVTVAAVHLESHSEPEDRDAQIAALLEAIEAYRPGAPALIAGDLNTFSMPLAQLADREALRQGLEADPARLRNPIAYEPLFERARSAGFEWESCNVASEPTHRVVETPDASSRGGLKLDWFLARGLDCRDARVIDAVEPGGSNAALSDHEAITVRVAAATAPP